ncbi:MAG: TetR/AcrR family transcriptional regulator [Bacillaceae bacterium]
MKKKEKIIIECAMKLFASKGFEATSIQEIVDLSGISKGTFYLYFKSKESLLMAIFQFFYELQKERMSMIDIENLPPREQLQKMIVIEYEDIKEHTEFIVMYAKEQAIPFNDEIAKFLQNMHDEMMEKYHRIFNLIYGQAIEPYLWDILIIFMGIFHSYAKLILFNHDSLDFEKLAVFLTKRLDTIVADLLASNEEPLICKPIVLNMESFYTPYAYKKEDILLKLQQAKEHYASLVNNEDLVITLEVLEEEIVKKTPRIPVIQGMLTNLSEDNQLVELKTMIMQFFKLS